MSGITSAKTLRVLRSMLIVGAAFGVLLATSCAPKAVDTDAIAKTLSQLDDDWSKVAASKNAEAVAAFYSDDAIAYPPNEPAAVGRAAAQKVWAGYFADSTFTISWKTDHAGASASGDLGFTAGTYEDSFMGPLGNRINEKGKYLCVWAKQADGTWKAVHDMWNTDSK